MACIDFPTGHVLCRDLEPGVFTLSDMMGALEPGTVAEIEQQPMRGIEWLIDPRDRPVYAPGHPMAAPALYQPHAYTRANPPTTGAEVEARAETAKSIIRSMIDAMAGMGHRVAEFDKIVSAGWQPAVRDSDMPGIRAAKAHAEAVAAFNPPPIQPSRVKPAISGMDATASGDHRLGRFGVSVD